MRHIRRLLPIALIGVGQSLHAETIIFEVDDGVAFIRAYDQFGYAIVEFIGEADSVYQCVIFDHDDKPIASSVAISELGSINIQGIAADQIAALKCRKVM